MFLEHTNKHNTTLIEYALELIKEKKIEPDSYVIDLDSIEQNSFKLLESGKNNNVKLYCMLKQLGRNPRIGQLILNCSVEKNKFEGIVAVDVREALQLSRAGLPIKHVGHLVQIPRCNIKEILEMKPEVITVYSVEKAQEIQWVMQQEGFIDKGYTQKVLLRVTGKNDLLYPSQEAGFAPNDLVKAIETIQNLKGFQFEGLTAFPCFLYNDQERRIKQTQNAQTLIEAVSMLQSKYEIQCNQVNMPSCTTVQSIEMIAQLGGTHGEPGHSLSGTSPDTIDAQDPLIPSMVYASEISHTYKNNSYCYGGGHYRRSGVKMALVKQGNTIEAAQVVHPHAEAIDYHFELEGKHLIGSPVVMAFRSQLFVTRSKVVLVSGLQRKKPTVDSVWDSQGNCIVDFSTGEKKQ